jgi:hypothetical protein
MDTGNILVNRFWKECQQYITFPVDRKLSDYYEFFYMEFLHYLVRLEILDKKIFHLKPKNELQILNPDLVPALKSLAFFLFDNIIGPYQMCSAFVPNSRATILQMYSVTTNGARSAFCVLNRSIRSTVTRRVIPWSKYGDDFNVQLMLFLEYQKSEGKTVNEARLKELRRLTNFY